MANIRLDLNSHLTDGATLTFRSPADCSEVTGLIVYYREGATTSSRVFQFADAHGNNVGSIDLFAANVLVKVILDTKLNRAYVQNADTNGYLERRFPGRTTEQGGAIFNSYETNQAGHEHASAFGEGNQTMQKHQTVMGRYSAHQNGELDHAMFAVGGGTSDTERANAFVVNDDGSLVLGEGCYGDKLPETGVKGQIFFLKV